MTSIRGKERTLPTAFVTNFVLWIFFGLIAIGIQGFLQNGVLSWSLSRTSSSKGYPFYLANTMATASSSEIGHVDGDNLLLAGMLTYRSPTAEDIPRCYEIESASYPADEAASLEALRYRCQNAKEYFQLCTLPPSDNNDDDDDDDEDEDKRIIVGFVCSTRCHEFTEESMSTHDPNGRLLAIHSVVVKEPYRRRGIAKAMLQHYVDTITRQQQQQQPQQQQSGSGSIPLQPIIESIVLLAKQHLLGFYVQCGFQVNRPSPIVHGQELWYELEQSCSTSKMTCTIRTLPQDGESWFCKTEQFQKPFSEVKPFLEQHKEWVETLRANGHCITSGYRVDAEGKPGGGGLMFLAAKSYKDALDIVLQDPLVANDCVQWELNGWIGQVGDIQMR